MKIRWYILIALVALAPIAVIGAAGQFYQPVRPVAVARSSDLKMDVASPEAGILAFGASLEMANGFRDAKYAYLVQVKDLAGVVVWEHLYEEPENVISGPKDKEVDIRLETKRIEVAAGTYRVYFEIREDARHVNLQGELIRPYYVLWGTSSGPVVVEDPDEF